MKANPQKYIALEGGLTCRPVNPYEETRADNLFNYDKFEANNPTYPTTEQIDEGEFMGVVKYLGSDDKVTWYEISESQYMRADEPKHTKKAIQPIKEEKEVPKHKVPDGKILQIMALGKSIGWHWMTVDKELQDACLNECRTKRKPYQLVDEPLQAVDANKDVESMSVAAFKYASDNGLDSKGVIAFCKGVEWLARREADGQSNPLESIVPKVLEWVAERAMAYTGANDEPLVSKGSITSMAPDIINHIKGLKK